MILIIAGAAFFCFVLLPTLLVFFLVFGRKKAVPFEQYNRRRYRNHYYIAYLGRIAQEREKILAYPHEPVSVVSYDGLTLYGEYYDRGSRRTAILFHGLGAEIYTNFSSQARFFVEHGFNVLLICHRAHGKSGGHWTTIGLREQKDVLSWTQWAEDHGSEQILLYGLSMGASAIAYASDQLADTKVCGVVLDSCYCSIYEQMHKDAVQRHIPKLLLYTERFMAKLCFRVDIKTPTTETLSRAVRPVLVIQGDNDLTVDPKWGKVLYDACTAPKAFLPVKGGPHTLNYLHDPEHTGEALLQFIGQYF